MTSTLKPTRLANIVLNNFKNDSRVLKISKSLAGKGYDVNVIALHEEPLPELEYMDGFQVNRIRLYTSRWPRKKFFQIFKYLEFTFRVLLRHNGFDVYHCNDLHTLPVGVLLKLFSWGKVRLVYDAHEYETEANGLSDLEKIFRRKLEGFLIRFADRTITVSESIANEYVKLYGIDKPIIILNIPELSYVEKHDLLRRDLGIKRSKRIFLYQGGLSYGRGLEILLNAFEGEEASDNVIVFMGYGQLEDEIKARASKSDAIYFHEAVPPNQIPLYTSSADVGISTIENVCLSYYYCLPNKLFEYLMAEIPVIVSNLYEMAKIVNENGLGVVMQDNTVEGVRQALRDMEKLDSKDFSVKVREFKPRYNWNNQEDALIQIYAGLEE